MVQAHYTDTQLAEYIDATLPKERMEEMNAHLALCPECLSEVAELSRINAVMDAAKSMPIRLPQRLQIKTVAGRIESIISSLYGIELVPMPVVRDSGMEERKEVVFLIAAYSVKVSPMEGRFWITVKPNDAKTYSFSIVKNGENAAFFQKTGAVGELSVKGIAVGGYKLVLDGQEISITIED